ncbi:insulinase family protein [Companilactobacillus allii]|uniref:Peptidase M16 n=1 Tax=Companilactobacillus allii TaxID=1847728 RepID=A0A1P8Q378_9LACO|nr:insulinase family protein [Companilactobacillus allii]APX72296.1 peptidase M16 [Companilactobacillus allii]USQ69387.1 insulinase family protein [Companilactobacillus allii]
MRKSIANNVALNIKPIKKFRTIKIQIDFLRPLSREETTKRRLLANVLSNSTKHYPTFKALNDREMELYGSEINVYTRNLLNFNDLAFSIEFADPKFLLHDPNQLSENLNLLGEIVFQPNLKNDSEFDDIAFDTEKRNLMSNLASIDDNQDLVSILGLTNLLYQDNPNRQVPIFGDILQLKALNNADLYDHYKDVLKNDAVVVNVVGDVDEEEFTKTFMDSEFVSKLKSDRQNLSIEFDHFDKLVNTPASKEDHKHLNQSRLAIAYLTKKIDVKNSRLAPQAMNLILGGDDQSQLFQQVREKNSLAYSVSSSYQPISHLVTIQAGLDAKKLGQATDLINKQIDFIKNDKFTDDQIVHAQKVMDTRREISSDSIQHYIMRSIWETVYSKSLLTDEQFKIELDKMDRKHIVAVAHDMSEIAQYRLIGD